MTGLQPLAAVNQWMVYKLIKRDNGKTDKIPLNPRSLQAADPTDPSNWADSATVQQALSLLGDGYGPAFQLTDNDPFFLLDIDHCIDANGTWSPIANTLAQSLPGACVEVSQSGTGLHIIGSLSSRPQHGTRDGANGLELYTADRFIALTGNVVSGDAGTNCDLALSFIIQGHFMPGPSFDSADWTDGPVDGAEPPTDDDELIRKACESGNPFNNRAKFRDLWGRNVDALAATYPDNDPQREYDYSQADAALAQHLAFWTAKDCERMVRLMRQSELYRDKWDREDYLPRTVMQAVGKQTDVFGKRDPVQIVESMRAEAEVTSGYQYMPLDQQIDYFKGCVYVRDLHRVLVPDGGLLKPDQFRAEYGGYDFQVSHGDAKPSRNAWDVFTESRAIRFPKVVGVEFDPLQPAGAIWDQDGQTVVNTWVGINPPRQQGDASRFLQHLALLIPDQRDQQYLLAYMAACVQHQGHKFQWTPLIQGTEGNGKTLFTRCVAHAIGKRYVHWPSAATIDSNFNAWLVGRTFFGVEDIYVPESKLHIWEALKPMITGDDGLQIERKGVDQVSARVVGNFMLNSNHKDAVRKTRGDRRVAPFFTAHQTPEEIEQAGMNGDYFPGLYDWLKHRGGYAIVADFLWSYQIPAELNPALGAGGLMHRAPVTSSTQEMIELSVGAIEQEIAESIEQSAFGFAGGYVSSYHLDNLLKDLGASRKVPRSKRRDMMQTLGYVQHPALPDGRATRVVDIDNNTRPRIYVEAARAKMHANADSGQAVQLYIEAQNKAVGSMAAGAFARGV